MGNQTAVLQKKIRRISGSQVRSLLLVGIAASVPGLLHAQTPPSRTSGVSLAPTTYTAPPSISVDITDAGGSFRGDIGAGGGQASVSGPRVVNPAATFCQTAKAANYFSVPSPQGNINCVIEECLDPVNTAKIYCVTDTTPAQLVLGPIDLTK